MLEKNAQKWISVEDRLPENEKDVLVVVETRCGMKVRRTVLKAFHTDGKHNTERSDYMWDESNIELEYDEAADAYIIPEGWWECVRYGDEFSVVDDFVTHWMPTPEPPEED